MKKTIYIIAMVLSGLAALSCTERGMETQESGHGIVLTLSTMDGIQPAVRSNGEDAYNENLLNSFYYFFYPLGADEVTPALNGFVTGISETGSYSRTIPVSSHIVNNILFKNSRDCQLFVVANPTDDIRSELEGQPTLKELRAMTVYAALKNVPQDNFVMVYDGTIRATSFSSETVVNATVSLKRLACKFNIGAYVTQSIDDGKKIYTPDTTGTGSLTVTFCNAVSHTALSGFSTDVVEAEDYFNSNVVGLTHKGREKINDTLYHHFSSTSPVYSYPMEWEFASETEPYLLYGLNWMIKDKASGSTEYRTLYYKLTLGRRAITANEWYDISAKLTVLGSLYPDDPKEVFPFMTYQVLDWNQAFEGSTPNTPAVITDTRFIAVPQTEWIVNNKDEVTIPFSSSHECVITNLNATKTSFYKESKGYDYGEHTTQDVTSTVTASFDDPKGQLRIRRPINNTLGDSGMDISPVTITLRIRHNDIPSFYSDITVIQYPAIWVDTERNSAGQDGSTSYGYILIDGTRNSTRGSISRADGADGTITTDENNTSRWFTIIHVNQFDQESNPENFVIGDPRKAEVDNLTDMWSKISGSPNSVVTAPRKYEGTNGVLSYYHPTIPARLGEEHSRKLYVAPAFRVCTAHARNQEDNTYPEAVLRCATYQEDGYPAGRWRLPTYAEIKLFRLLSDAKLIPNLFYNTGKYTYAGGMCNGTTFTDGIKADINDMGACRCVYDEWYWSQIDKEFGWDNSNKTTFTWGDIPTDYTHPASH